MIPSDDNRFYETIIGITFAAQLTRIGWSLMIESCGGNFHEGSYHGNGLQLIREYFQQRSCRHCCMKYAPEGIELVRQEPGIMVVKVACAACGEPLGIALVGMTGNKPSSEKAPSRLRGQHLTTEAAYPPDWSKSDIKRLSSCAPISYDDVLDAHKFFSELDSNWNQLLPERARRTQRSRAAGQQAG